MPVTDTTALAAALAYLRHGWHVAPIPPGKKYPAGLDRWQDTRADADLLQQWWQRWPDHGLGILTGTASGIFVVDVDVTDGKQGDETLNDLQTSYGDLPDTVTVVTGTGGQHLYFKLPDGVRIPNSAGNVLGPGLDVRGEGGQVVAPPTVHPNGQRYEYEDGLGPDDITVADAPGWLLALLDKAADEEAAAARRHELARARATMPPGDRPGDIWAAQTTWADLLEPDGWTLHHIDQAGEQHWTRPGKQRREGTSATTGYRDSDVLKVFSTSCAPLEAEATYTKLGYLATTRHGGDHAAAARSLAAQGHRAPDTTVQDLLGTPAPAAPLLSLFATDDEDDTAGTAPPEPPGPPPTNLPDEFWNSRPELAHIRQAAHSRVRSADSVLAGVLARVSALTGPWIKLPAIVGAPGTLDVVVALIGRSGAGKSSSAKVAAELVPIDPVHDKDVVCIPLGSGEGLIEAYMEWVTQEDADGKKRKVKTHTKNAVLAELDEGEALAEMGGRKGATLLPIIRSAWSGGLLGQANATEDRKRILQAGSYRFALIAGFQLEVATALIDDAAGGTPQRFLYFAAEDPAIPDEPPAWPGDLGYRRVGGQRRAIDVHPDIAAEIRTRARERSRGKLVIDPLDSHRDLNRLKVAGLLSFLADHHSIDTDDWRLAGILLDTSDQVRASIIAAAQQRAHDSERRQIRRKIAEVAALEVDQTNRATETMAAAIGRHVHRSNCDGGCVRRCVTQATSGKHRKTGSIDDAIALAERNRWITERDGQYLPGSERP